LKSYHAAKQELMPSVEHRQENNRAENSHQPTRLRERVMRRFKVSGPGAAVPFSLRDHHVTLPPRATPLSRRLYREMMKRRFAALEEVVGGVEKY
jgi:putative transposase